MTAPALTFVQAVRDFIELEPGATSKYSDQTISSNIRQASWFLERATHRLFADQTRSMTFSTNGDPYVTIPGLRSATAVVWNGATLTADQSYWLVPDVQQTGVATGLQLRGFDQRRDDYLAYSDWFDTGKDSPKWRGQGSVPNDLVITGDWGYEEAELPEPVRFATKALAAFLTKYPDAILIGSTQTGAGSIDLSGFPLPVQQFVTDWAVGSGVASG